MALKTQTFSHGSLTDKSVLNGYLLELTVTEQSTDTVKNISAVDFVLKLRSGSKNRFESYGLGASVSLNGKVVGTRDRATASRVSLGYNSSVTLVKGSADITHNDDGTLTMPVAFSIDMATGSYVPGPVSVTGKSMTLTVIPRASTVAASDANIGAVSTVVVGRKSANYTHTVAVSFGEIAGYLNADGALVETAEKLTATTIPFAIPENFYQQIPDKASDKCALSCTTYSGSSVIGTKETSFTVTAARDLCAPEVAISVQDVNGDTVALTGDEKTLIRFFSTARCFVTAQAKNGAAITSLTVEGQDVADFIDFPNAEQNTFTAVATDSRGYTTPAVATAELIHYIQLTCNASAKRLSPTGGDALVTVKGNYYNGTFGAEGNALALSYRINGGEAQPATPIITENSYTAEIYLEGLDYTQTHTIEVIASDCLQDVPKPVTVNPGIPVFDWGKNDFAFHVPVSMPGITIDGIQPDVVVEEGTTDSWIWRKWRSGKAECYRVNGFQTKITTTWGTMYTSDLVTERIDYPIAFTKIPIEVVSVGGGNGWAAWLVATSGGRNTQTQTGFYKLCRPDVLNSAADFYINYAVMGFWK